MQLGFVIDHSRCIGCHACTVACKSENDVPVGSFRTWVKYTERGSFPEVRRSFAVLRCNQCTDAPCVTICPVRALHKRPDGIVDIDPQRCIGCKGCLQGCPYDALYINDESGTAEKCHFCAHRVERGLAPACAVVCPTEAIVPGDFDDPESRVSRLESSGRLQVRKPEAGTRPNVRYREVERSAIDPLEANASGGYLWADRVSGPQLDAQLFEQLERKASARTVYDVSHPPAWGSRVSAYLFTKALASGIFLAAMPLLPPFGLAGTDGGSTALRVAGLGLFFLAVTTAFLIGDLKRPERFLHILRYANPDSWLSRGAVVLGAYGALLAAGVASELGGFGPGVVLASSLAAATGLAAILTAIYTAWLFHQSRGRVLWLRRSLALEFLAHAVVAGAALLLLLAPALGLTVAAVTLLRGILGVALLAHLALTFLEGRFPPRGRVEEYRRAQRLVTHGPYARRHWGVGVVVGVLLPLVLLVPAASPAWNAAALLAMIGLFSEQDTLVRAGQALAIS